MDSVDHFIELKYKHLIVQRNWQCDSNNEIIISASKNVKLLALRRAGLNV